MAICNQMIGTFNRSEFGSFQYSIPTVLSTKVLVASIRKVFFKGFLYFLIFLIFFSESEEEMDTN